MCQRLEACIANMCLHSDEVIESIWWLESNERSSNIFEDIGYYMCLVKCTLQVVCVKH